MLKSSIKFLAYLFLTIILSIISLFYFVNNNNGSMNFTIPVIKSLLFTNYKTDIKSIDFSKNHDDLIFDVSDINLSKKYNQIHIDKFSLSINLKQLIKREKFISINTGNIEYKSEYTEAENKKNPNIKNIFKSIYFIKDINIENIDINIEKTINNYNLKLDHARFESSDNKIRADLSFGNESFVKMESSIENNIVKSNISFNNFPNYIITELFFPNINKDDIYIISNGKFNFDYDIEKRQIDGKITNDNSSGLISNNHKFNIPECIISIKNNQLDFEHFVINLNENSKIKLNSNLQYGDNYKYLDHVNLDINIDNVEINDLKFLWPNILFPNIKKWINDNIKNGKINAKGHFNFSVNDLKSAILPENSVNIEIDFDGASLNYYHNLPELRNLSGKTVINEKYINTNIEKGKIVNSEISSAEILIPYDNNIKIKGIVKGDAKDIVSFITEDDLKSARDENIILENIKGKATTSIDLEIPTSSESKLKIYVKSNLQNISLDNLMYGFNLSDSSLNVVFNGKKLLVKGNGFLSGNDIKIDWSKCFDYSCEFSSKTIIDMNLNQKSFRNIYQNSNFNDGLINLKSTIISKDNIQKLDAIIVADNAAIRIDELGYNKNIGSKLEANIGAQIKDKIISLNNINIFGKDINIRANAVIDKDKKLSILELPIFKINNNDLNISYKNLENNIRFAVKGKKANLKDVDFNNLFKSNRDENNKKHISINVDDIYLKNDHHINNLNAEINCSEKICDDININASIREENDVELKSKKIDENNTEFVFKSKNISDILQSFDLYQNLKGGELKVKLNRNNKSNKFIGLAKLKNFVAIKTPVLSKLFTFTSLPKIIELPFAFLPGEKISGNDIPFTNLVSNFVYENDILRVIDSTIEGPQIGLTSSGIVDFDQKTINMSGNVVPELLGVSKVINNIPLLGNIIQGGKNKGLVAASYSVKGKFGDVHTFVNPLSILTPGFMRNMFDIFEHNRKEIDKD